jgi:outer membrane protein assembly factor BamE (lipoprotein component of BamABCDE complex)
MKTSPVIVMLGVFLAATSGCMTAQDHQRNVGIDATKDWTLGMVQKEIHPGMSQADVATALGSPNIVSRDAGGRETWIYDKVGRETVFSDSAVAGGLIIIAGHRASGATRQSEKTATVVIRFDEKGTVATTAYHASQY